MKKHLFTIVALFFAISNFSQTSTGNEITAEGSATMKVAPDRATLTITAIKHNAVEKLALKELNEETAKLQKMLLEIGFKEQSIRISEYKISNEDREADRKDFVASHTLTVDFVLNNAVVEAFYQGIQSENLNDLDIAFEALLSSSLEKKMRKKLVNQAILDAKSNAEDIAETLQVKLLNVKQVTKYNMRVGHAAMDAESAAEVRFAKPVYNGNSNPKTSFDKFEVADIDLEETITVIYEIAKK